MENDQLSKTVLHEWHKKHAHTMGGFGGFDMPIIYGQQGQGSGTLFEHLSTRKNAGLFDISYMGRFIISGDSALPFLSHVLSNNALALREGEAQYTIIPDENGNAVDDAYLYRLPDNKYMLVVNASNRQKDWEWLHAHKGNLANTSRTPWPKEQISLLVLSIRLFLGHNAESLQAIWASDHITALYGNALKEVRFQEAIAIIIQEPWSAHMQLQ